MPKKTKPVFGSHDGFSYAVNVKGLSGNDFFKCPFGRQIDDMKKIQAFIKDPATKENHVGAKHKSTMPCVKKWVKLYEATEFYARWPEDSKWYKDDSVQIYYRTEGKV